MADRRSLGAAIKMSPEKAAFIQGGAPQAPKAEVTPSVAIPATAQDVTETLTTEATEADRTPRRSRSRRQTRAPIQLGEGTTFGIANLLAPLTTRLQPTT